MVYASVVEKLAVAMPRPAWIAANAVLRKTWVTRGDAKVRPLHRKLHGRVRRFGEDFWRWPGTGGVLRYPGDPLAPLDTTVNCRCVLWLSWGVPREVPPFDR